jgi:hypothetical protein
MGETGDFHRPELSVVFGRIGLLGFGWAVLPDWPTVDGPKGN